VQVRVDPTNPWWEFFNAMADSGHWRLGTSASIIGREQNDERILPVFVVGLRRDDE
jgi:hypothetical protein